MLSYHNHLGCNQNVHGEAVLNACQVVTRLSIEGGGFSPSLGVVAVASLLGKVLVPAADVDVLALLHAGLFRVLLEVGNVVRCVATLHNSVGGSRLLLALPKQVATQRLSELGSQHVAAGGARREGTLSLAAAGRGRNSLGG